MELIDFGQPTIDVLSDIATKWEDFTEEQQIKISEYFIIKE